MRKATERLVVVLFWVGIANCADATFGFKDCAGSESILTCYGSRIVQNVVKRLSSEKSLKLMPGVEIVSVNHNDDGPDRTVSNEISNEREGVLERIGRYLENHALKINLGDVVQRNLIQDVVRSSLSTVHRQLAENFEEARKKDKGGLGLVVMMGLMMGKMLGALGVGSVAMLAMKALGVSMMALLLSSIIGLKKLSESGDHKGRQSDVDIRVSTADRADLAGGYDYGYDPAEVMRRRRGRRRRRSLETKLSPFRGWSEMLQ
ncbi:uncharacterized protein LOC131425790 [Malaya genurostris]|uniref:uncharacterized protein LOC131425790 n=1 Tax=Malaya genurostris TaxID=325434 RepID=UPI0026F38189|nr:uncharacterized protein LOC131425790 [Malaya genurostris]